jgi:hypothetical protein
MAKEKVTITLDRAKAETARKLLGIKSTSQVIDVALARCIKAERLRRDVEAYKRLPPTEEEMALARLSALPDLPDEVDWEALY